MDTITEHSVIVRADDLAVTDLDGETVILNINDGQYFGLNAVGTHVFTQTEEPVEVAAIIDQLATRFADVPRAQVADDVMVFLTKMHEHGLVFVSDEQGAEASGAAR
jgi:hypothetical protein